MGFYLIREGEVKRRYGISRWPAMLRLARAYGWKPAGTTIDEESGIILTGKWTGSYEAMAGELVSTEDASNLAAALERALTHFPRQDEEETLQYQLKNNLWRPPNEYESKALQWFIKDEEQTDFQAQSLVDFIAFCREGAFRID
jgi:hypothetical protein